MVRKGLVVFWWMVFCLLVLVGCKGGGGGSTSEVKKEDSKIEVVPPVTTDPPPSTPEVPATIQLEVVPASKTMKPGETFTFSGKGGEPPYSYSANFGAIDSLGLYTFSEGIKEGDVVKVTDSKQNVASSIIFGDFTNLWAWSGGTKKSVEVLSASYGIKGQSSPFNWPGGRTDPVTWIDSQGNRWLFGGLGLIEGVRIVNLNDLWKFDLTTKEWTWMGGANKYDVYKPYGEVGIYGNKGQFSPTNWPGGRRDSVAWSDSENNLWLFGGFGNGDSPSEIFLNDLWKFDLAKKEWAWIGGANKYEEVGIYGIKGESNPTNWPGGRSSSVGWMDFKKNFWLFGGIGYSDRTIRENLNDLWKFDLTTKEWTWMGGANKYDVYKPYGEVGIYGNKGQFSPTNWPGGRRDSVAWSDSENNLWLFGGFGNGDSPSEIFLNDLWKFDLAKKEWAWIGGANKYEEVGIYGIKGESNPTNWPGGRSSSMGWMDFKKNFWLFGGIGYSDRTVQENLNDLWKFDLTTKEWTWMGGANKYNVYTDGEVGFYGTNGLPSPSNWPGSRSGHSLWTDNQGNFWLFGGDGLASDPSSKIKLNDLWKFTPPKN